MEQNLKQRLVGAIVLVSLAVIFIPIILEGPDDEWTPRSHSIPEPPQMDYRASMQLPLPADSGEKPTATPAAANLAGNGQPDPEPEPEPAPQPQPAAAPAPQPEPEAAAEPAAARSGPADKPAAVPAGWYVQVGSFSQPMNASGLRDRLKAAGYDSRMQATGSRYRVLVGPADSRKQAEQQRDKLLAGQQLKGIVIQHSG